MSDWTKFNQAATLCNNAKFGTDEYAALKQLCRDELADLVGDVWDSDEVGRDFVIDSFGYGLAFGRRKSDGAKVSLDFTHRPRFYFRVTEES